MGPANPVVAAYEFDRKDVVVRRTVPHRLTGEGEIERKRDKTGGELQYGDRGGKKKGREWSNVEREEWSKGQMG